MGCLEDFDFAMSKTFIRGICAQHGEDDPWGDTIEAGQRQIGCPRCGAVLAGCICDSPSEEKPQPLWSNRQWDIVQQLRGEVAFLNRKLTERDSRRQPRPPTGTMKDITT